MIKLPVISMNTVFLVGSYVFGIQASCNIVLFFMNLRFQNFFSATSSWAGIIFSLVLAYFFSYMRQQSLGAFGGLSQGTGVVDEDEMREIVDKLREGEKDV
jgi:uncharacterized RDD family membrane protein YckC